MSDELIDTLADLTNDPLGFVLWAFPWGEAGSELEAFQGPEKWQRELLEHVGQGLLTPNEAIRIATASGHGIGKSALVSWIILWSISTFEDARGVVTANTETQLKTKTWAELGKWYRLFIGKELFKFTATALFSVDREHEKTWRVDMVPWSERNMEAFAGLHNKGRRLLLLMDEASAIPDPIWETAEGALTDSDTQILWLVFGNPTKPTGRFKECWSSFAHRWKGFRVDSREVSISNKRQIEDWIKDYGEDSDFVRVRVRGIFPRVGSMQFIGEDLAREATKREVFVHLHDPFVIGVDVARFGDNDSVICFRKGRDSRSTPWIVLRGVDTMTLAGRVAEAYNKYRADAVFVDGGGVGGGVVDRLRQLRVPVFDVQFGGKADTSETEGEKYANKRSEMWGKMRRWLPGGALPEDEELIAELTLPEYGYNNQSAILLQSKTDMKKSPDRADALALTFAYDVQSSSAAGGEMARPSIETEYDPFNFEDAA